MNSDQANATNTWRGPVKGLASVQAEFVVDEQNVTCFQWTGTAQSSSATAISSRWLTGMGSPIAK